MVADAALRRHGREQRVAGRDGRQGVVPHQLLQFTVPAAAAVGARLAAVCAHLVKGDGAVVEVQRGGRGHVGRGAVLVQVGGAVAEDGLLFDGSRHQVGGAERRGDHGQAVSAGLDLQLLTEGGEEKGRREGAKRPQRHF